MISYKKKAYKNEEAVKNDRLLAGKNMEELVKTFDNEF